MKKSQRLKVIVDLNTELENKALDEMAKAQNEKQQAQAQLKSLEQYKQEYKDKYLAVAEPGVSITQLVEFRAFINKLNTAIIEQSQRVADLDEQSYFAKENWEKQQQKTNRLEKVCQSALTEEIKQQDIREQKEQDERSSRIDTQSVYPRKIS